LEPLISAGFLLIKPSPRPNWHEPSLLPEQIVSASDCLCPRFPGPYAITWSSGPEASQREGFEAVGLAPETWREAEGWATAQFGRAFGWPGVFFNLDAARAAQTRFFSRADPVWLVGLGLPEGSLGPFLSDAGPAPPQPGYSPFGASGYYELLERRQPLPPGGRLVGFELLNVEGGQVSHSWLCNHLEKHCADRLGIWPAHFGLLPDLPSARRCLKEITRDDVGAEPGLWLAWALVRYDQLPHRQQ
jgi:hypothetical protein